MEKQQTEERGEVAEAGVTPEKDKLVQIFFNFYCYFDHLIVLLRQGWPNVSP